MGPSSKLVADVGSTCCAEHRSPFPSVYVRYPRSSWSIIERQQPMERLTGMPSLTGYPLMTDRTLLPIQYCPLPKCAGGVRVRYSSASWASFILSISPMFGSNHVARHPITFWENQAVEKGLASCHTSHETAEGEGQSLFAGQYREHLGFVPTWATMDTVVMNSRRYIYHRYTWAAKGTVGRL
jgi:hypothetical protein